MATVPLLLTIMYVCLMALYCIGWRKQRTFTVPDNYQPSTFISVIIPARNEAVNIGACIKALLAQHYPAHLYEIIVVDDHSDDGTAAIVEQFADARVRCIRLADRLGDGVVNAYKKAALTAGIAESRGALVVTTDADCTAPAGWLQHMAAKYEAEQPVMIVAPVVFHATGGLLGVFQSIDFMSMQGITAAAQAMKLGKMSNGANLAFSREAFHKIGGYAGTEHLASGDDYLLMVKMSEAYPEKVSYLKSEQAIISTASQPTWQAFFRQRIRWASKSGKYKDTVLTAILLLVYLLNVSLVVLFIVGLFNNVYLQPLMLLLAVKTITELIFLWPVAGFYKRRSLLLYFPFLQPLHILYIVSAGFFGFMGGYEWKGRRVR